MNDDFLQKIPLFKDLSIDTIHLISSHARIVEFGNGEIIMMEGDFNAPIFFVIEGTVRAFLTNPDGREQVLTYLQPGDGFNLPSAFSINHLSPASALAVGAIRILQISQEDFRYLVENKPEFAGVIMRDLSEKLIHLTNLVHDVSLRSVRSRLAKFLLIQSESRENPANKWTQEEIASQLGTKREVFSRSLKEMIQEGLIKTERQKIIILDPEKLKTEADL
jgi:CRP-like cAMP-binding protein